MRPLAGWASMPRGCIYVYQNVNRATLPTQIQAVNRKLPSDRVTAMQANHDGHMIRNPASKHQKPLKGPEGPSIKGLNYLDVVFL